MSARERAEFLVYPRFFHARSFYSRGQYSLRVKLLVKDQSKTSSQAQGFPILLEGSDSQKQEESKRPQVQTQQAEPYFQTENFYITYSEQKITMTSMCLFKLELPFDQSKADSSITVLSFELIFTSFKNKLDSLGNSTKVMDLQKVVTSRDILINSHPVAEFRRLVFDEGDFFSSLDVYIASFDSGIILPRTACTLKTFGTMPINEKRNESHLKEPSQSDEEQFTEQLKNLLHKHTLKSLHTRLVASQLAQYKHLRDVYHNLKHTYELYSDIVRFPVQVTSSYNSNIHSARKNLISTAHSELKTQNSSSQNYYEFEDINLEQAGGSLDLQEVYESTDEFEIAANLYEESLLIVNNCFFVWNRLIKLLFQVSLDLFVGLSLKTAKQQLNSKHRHLQFFPSKITQQVREQQKFNFIRTRKEYFSRLPTAEEDDFHLPFMMFENYSHDSLCRTGVQTDSLLVFVHGYQGSDIDLEKARNFLNLYSPHCYGLLAKTLQSETEHGINELGRLLAEEVKSHILVSCHIYKRISFLGYSLGGVVVRQAMKHLKKLESKFHMLITFASPHLGINDCSNMLVRLGIWYLTSFDKSKHLQQLNCAYDEQFNMEQLAHCEGLSWFSTVVAVSSKEDDFVPYHSSRIDSQASSGKAQDMGRLIIAQIQNKLERVEVWFDIEHNVGAVDKILGRRAHIEFLQNRSFLDNFFARYGPRL